LYEDTYFNISIGNFYATSASPIIPEEVYMSIYIFPGGVPIATWGDLNTAGVPTPLPFGSTDFTLSLMIDDSNNVSGHIDYGTGSLPVEEIFSTLSFTPGSDVYTGGFGAGENVIPIPGAIWLLGFGLIGLAGFRIKKRN